MSSGTWLGNPSLGNVPTEEMKLESPEIGRLPLSLVGSPREVATAFDAMAMLEPDL
jgi:hypothetical protein